MVFQVEDKYGKLMSLTLTNFHHFFQLLDVSRNKIKEGQFIKVLCSLIRHFHNLNVTRMFNI